MVDCYLTTYNNQKGYFGNKKAVAKSIIDHPEKYHIYEGISSMTNISRYDLPDPATYKQFFSVNPLYDFQSLQSTCTFFKGMVYVQERLNDYAFITCSFSIRLSHQQAGFGHCL